MLAIWQWVVGHSAVVSGLVVGILDFIFALIPSLSGNGILHQLYIWVKGFMSPLPPTTPPPAL